MVCLGVIKGQDGIWVGYSEDDGIWLNTTCSSTLLVRVCLCVVPSHYKKLLYTICSCG